MLYKISHSFQKKYEPFFIFLILVLITSCTFNKSEEIPTSSFHCLLTEAQQKEIPYLEPGTTPVELSLQICPQEQHRKDDGTPISKDEWDTAVAIIVRDLDSELLNKIEPLAEKNPQQWWKKQYILGLPIRDLLRENGIDWGDQALNDYWPKLAEDAAMAFENDLAFRRAIAEKIKHGYEPMEISG